MLLSVIYAVVHLLLDVLLTKRERDRELEILVLRHQLNVLQRTAGRPRFEPSDRLILAALTRNLPARPWQSLLVSPETVLRWHRELVRRKWAAFGRRGRLGRRPIPAELRQLILRLALENPTWGYLRVKGELRKLGHQVSASTIRRMLRSKRIPPAGRRGDAGWASSSGLMLDQPSPATSLPSTRFSCVASTFSSLLNSPRAVFSSLGAPPTRMPPGPRSRRAISLGESATASCGRPS